MSRRIVVDWIACEGHGICAELLPERIQLDPWGYPIVDPRPLPSHLEAHVRRAAAGCPTLALLLREAEAPSEAEVRPGPRSGSRSATRGTRR